nr:FeoB small GTPase domain-containing protein [Clostridium senegalense]
MGLTFDSTKKENLKDIKIVEKNKSNQYIISLAGNPNTGKSTVFNELTGLHQHTGNWPGKTVVNSQGTFNYKNNEYILVDLPGTYSLLATSSEEEVARDYICFGQADLNIVVVDATCLERNLNLLIQILELNPKVLVCLNLIDEAKKKNIEINVEKLKELLSVPVVVTSARNGEGIDTLKENIEVYTREYKRKVPFKIDYGEDIERKVDSISGLLYKKYSDMNYRWVSLRLLDGDKTIINSIRKYVDENFLLYDDDDTKKLKNYR